MPSVDDDGEEGVKMFFSPLRFRSPSGMTKIVFVTLVSVVVVVVLELRLFRVVFVSRDVR